MNKKAKVRRSCKLCLSFARSYALYKASYNDDGSHIVGGQFWNTELGNNIDIAVIEWCKLFGNYDQEKHHWKRVVKDRKHYKTQLLTEFENSEAKWAEYHKSILKYRNKFVAHLDVDNEYIVPLLEIALKLISKHYDYLLQYEVEDGFFNEPIPNDIQSYYEQHFALARKVYADYNSKN
jgi:hypothetical protein